MLKNIEKATIKTSSFELDYISFGNGSKVLAVFPGISEALVDINLQVNFIYKHFKKFADDYKIYIFGRNKVMKAGYSILDMARDQKDVFDLLNISEANLFGISQGGFIAQTFAHEYPEMVSKMVIALSAPRCTSELDYVLSSWIDYTKKEDIKNLVTSIAKHNDLGPLKKTALGFYLKNNDLSSFLIQAKACKKYDYYKKVTNIKCPTLVLASSNDEVVGLVGSVEINRQINNSNIIIYENIDHDIYKSSNFVMDSLNFLKK